MSEIQFEIAAPEGTPTIELQYSNRQYMGIPKAIMEGAALNVAHRRGMNEGDLKDVEEYEITDYYLAAAALIGSGLLEQYRIPTTED